MNEGKAKVFFWNLDKTAEKNPRTVGTFVSSVTQLKQVLVHMHVDI